MYVDKPGCDETELVVYLGDLWGNRAVLFCQRNDEWADGLLELHHLNSRNTLCSSINSNTVISRKIENASTQCALGIYINRPIDVKQMIGSILNSLRNSNKLITISSLELSSPLNIYLT